ncbi:MAG: M12 family metallo-peptidase [Ignavibacteria bacterium]
MNKKLFHFIGMVLMLSIFIFTDSYSQSKTVYNLFSLNDNSSLINTPELQKAVSDALIFSVNKNELQSLYENRLPEIVLNVPVSRSNLVRVNLSRFDILTPDAKIVSRTARGNEEIPVSSLDLAVSYKGKLEGMDNSLVSITFTKDGMTGLLVSEADNYIIGSMKDNAGNETDNIILYKESDMKIKSTFNCETEDNLSSEYLERMRQIIIQKMNDRSPTDLYVAEIAIEIDFPTYNTYGSSITNTTNYALALMSAASAIYMKEVNVKFVIPYLRIWTTTDPYDGTTSNALLNQFRSEWNSNQQSVPRTLAHFITRRSGNLGGIAWLNALCSSPSSGFGYGFSNTEGPILPLPTYSWDVMVVCHEIGHNFGSNHTHNCGWVGGPIDSCYATEGGCYTGPPIARVGTIMSYCHLNGSISLVKGFGPQPLAIIRNNAESAGCMYIASRELEVGYPNGGETFRTGSSTQIYWGTSLTGNLNIEYSTNNGATWQTVQNNVSSSPRVYDWTIPYVSTSLESKLRIISSSNPNVGDTCNASFRIILNVNVFSVLSPPSLSRIEVSPSNPGTQKFVWQSGGTNPTLTYKVKIRKLGTSTDYTFLADNNGHDTAATIRKSLLDSVANTMGTTGDSVRCSWRSWGFNGFDSSASNNSYLLTFVRTKVGINVISSVVPEQFSLGNNYPNPFNPETNIKFDIAKSTLATLVIFDSRGREINTLINEKLAPGSYQYSFNAINLPSGVYFYRLVTTEFSETKRMILIK